MEHGKSAGSGHSTNKSTLDNSSLVDAIPQYPGEDSLAHTATTYKEQLDAYLAGKGLLSAE